MHLSHLQKNFEERRARAGVIYALGSPATRSAILDLESLERVGDAIRFSVVDRVHGLAFDVSEANEAVSGRSGTKQTATP